MKMRIPFLLFSAFQHEGHTFEADRSTFFHDKERGWFWREEFIEPPLPKPKKEKHPTPIPARDSTEEIQPLS